MKKFIHFIPHTHWDREWYMSFEKHRYRLVKLIDTLLETLENNPDFISYHMDGQVILLEDYLEVRPDKLDTIKKFVINGRINIGPNYILPDEFLICAEANVRNILYGIKECEKYGGNAAMIGYFPDAFGNISQMPQILKGFNIETAFFGRGVTSIGADNSVLDNKKVLNSEMIWQSPDGSEVIGVLFANWYHNAMEIPSDKEKALEKIEQIKERAEKFANTPHLLFMNGCDHQPVQTNLPQIIKDISPDTDDILKISSLDAYAEEIKKYSEKFEVFQGEFVSQFSDGWWALINTASSRIYIKQMNHQAQRSLVNIAEPLGIFSLLSGGIYDKQVMDLSWKTLLKNHPHDSICGCSIDDVHKEMEVRFIKSMDISESLISDNLRMLSSSVDTSFCSKGEIPLTLFNMSLKSTEAYLSALIDFDENDELDINELSIVDKNGNIVPSSFEYLGRMFKYELPDDTFRKVKYVKRVKVYLKATELPCMGYTTYKIIRSKTDAKSDIIVSDTYAENTSIRIDFNRNGSIKLTDKKNGKIFDNLNMFEDTGDIGDEYTYHQTQDQSTLYSENDAVIELWHNGSERAVFKITNSLSVPINADRVKKHRNAVKEELKIISYVTLWAYSDIVQIKTEFENTVYDHRLRALFPSAISADTCKADGQFDIVERSIKPWEGWENPSNCQRQQAFVSLDNDNYGIMIANKGLCEYEILRDGKNTIAITLLRSVSHLGDWGEFPTPDAQCLGKHTVEYSIIPFNTSDYSKACDLAYEYSYNPHVIFQSDIHCGKNPSEKSFITLEKGNGIVFSALKKAEGRDSIVLRIYNNTNNTQNAVIRFGFNILKVNLLNLNEDVISELQLDSGRLMLDVKAKKIITLELVI